MNHRQQAFESMLLEVIGDTPIDSKITLQNANNSNNNSNSNSVNAFGAGTNTVSRYDLHISEPSSIILLDQKVRKSYQASHTRPGKSPRMHDSQAHNHQDSQKLSTSKAQIQTQHQDNRSKSTLSLSKQDSAYYREGSRVMDIIRSSNKRSNHKVEHSNNSPDRSNNSKIHLPVDANAGLAKLFDALKQATKEKKKLEKMINDEDVEMFYLSRHQENASKALITIDSLLAKMSPSKMESKLSLTNHLPSETAPIREDFNAQSMLKSKNTEGLHSLNESFTQNKNKISPNKSPETLTETKQYTVSPNDKITSPQEKQLIVEEKSIRSNISQEIPQSNTNNYSRLSMLISQNQMNTQTNRTSFLAHPSNFTEADNPPNHIKTRARNNSSFDSQEDNDENDNDLDFDEYPKNENAMVANILESVLDDRYHGRKQIDNSKQPPSAITAPNRRSMLISESPLPPTTGRPAAFPGGTAPWRMQRITKDI